MSFIEELKRRNVIRVGVAYLVACWLLLQVLDVVGEILTLPENVARYTLFLLVAGFLPVLIIAWVYELTPEGLKLESEVDRSQSIAPHTGRKLDRAIIAILALAVGLLLFDKLALQKPVEQPLSPDSSDQSSVSESAPVTRLNPRSVAVLPFAVMSNGPDDNYFSDGLTEEIINSLAQLPDLLVTARTSAFHFKNRNEPIEEIARQLGVAHVVEGSVRRAGGQLRITAQLIRATDGFHLWSETYDRRTEDTFAVQTDIATKVADALDIFLDDSTRSQIQRYGTRNVEAFIALQKGIEFYERAHAEPEQISLLRRANQEFERAARLEPSLSSAYEHQTDLYTHILMSHAAGEIDGDITPEDVVSAPAQLDRLFDLAIRHASTQNELNNAVFSKALITGAWRGLEQLSLRAFSADSCDTGLWHQIIAAPFGQEKQILDAFKRMRICDPLLVQGYVHVVAAWLWNDQSAEAIAAGEAVTDWITNPLLLQNLAVAKMLNGDPEGARESARKLILSERELLEVLAQLSAIDGDAETARAPHEERLNRFGTNDRHSLVIAALSGDRNEANRLAALIDSKPAGHMVLLQATYFCICGAPFDLEATPNFAAMFAESELSWPPSKPYELPLKDW